MPKVDLTDGEITEIAHALDMAAKSAHRAQNTGRTPQIKAVYETQERTIDAIKHKITAAK